MKDTWKFWGNLKSGESCYVTSSGTVCVERDHRTLVQPTPEEKQEIYRTWPGLIDRAEDKRGAFPIENVVDTGALKDTIIDLEFEAVESRNIIKALKDANEEREKLIIALMADVEKYKEQISMLHFSARERKKRTEELERQYVALEALRK